MPKSREVKRLVRRESEALKRRIETADGWPEGISDGLSLPCCVCRLPVAFDYGVDDTFWQVVVPKEYKQSVVCLSCLATLASEKGRQIGEHLRFVQFVGIGETVVLLPESVYQYATYKRPKVRLSAGLWPGSKGLR